MEKHIHLIDTSQIFRLILLSHNSLTYKTKKREGIYREKRRGQTEERSIESRSIRNKREKGERERDNSLAPGAIQLSSNVLEFG